MMNGSDGQLTRRAERLVCLVRHASVLAAASLLVAFAPGVARACPSCAAGEAARSQIWADGISFNLAAAALPFVVVAAVSAALHRIGQGPHLGQEGDAPAEHARVNGNSAASVGSTNGASPL